MSIFFLSFFASYKKKRKEISSPWKRKEKKRNITYSSRSFSSWIRSQLPKSDLVFVNKLLGQNLTRKCLQTYVSYWKSQYELRSIYDLQISQCNKSHSRDLPLCPKTCACLARMEQIARSQGILHNCVSFWCEVILQS